MKVVLTRDLVLFVLDDFAIELYQSTTLGADQVIVMLVVVEVLVARAAVAEPSLRGPAHTRQGV